MAKRVLVVFEVTGNSWFPFDMLRYDCCYPYTENDSAELANDDLRVVRLSRFADKNWKPTEGRWKSFGWDLGKIEYRTFTG